MRRLQRAGHPGMLGRTHILAGHESMQDIQSCRTSGHAGHTDMQDIQAYRTPRQAGPPYVHAGHPGIHNTQAYTAPGHTQQPGIQDTQTFKTSPGIQAYKIVTVDACNKYSVQWHGKLRGENWSLAAYAPVFKPFQRVVEIKPSSF